MQCDHFETVTFSNQPPNIDFEEYWGKFYNPLLNKKKIEPILHQNSNIILKQHGGRKISSKGMTMHKQTAAVQVRQAQLFLNKQPNQITLMKGVTDVSSLNKVAITLLQCSVKGNTTYFVHPTFTYGSKYTNTLGTERS